MREANVKPKSKVIEYFFFQYHILYYMLEVSATLCLFLKDPSTLSFTSSERSDQKKLNGKKEQKRDILGFQHLKFCTRTR